jgi:folate-dependent tRNA-U54 methylase TrmFO/GidA
MKLRILIAAAAFVAAGGAFAFHRSADTAKIVAALAKHPTLTEAQAAEVKKCHADGESLH